MSKVVEAPLSIPQMSPGAFFGAQRAEIAASLMRVVDSGWYILGSEVKAFEEEFAGCFQFAGAVGVGNGTDAIALALRVLGIGPGDRVATVSHTAVATVAAIEMTGARPVFVDIDAGTYTMSPTSLRRALEVFAPVRAVIAVHLYGHPAEMPLLETLAHQHGAHVIEDCSQAHGAKLDGRNVGGMSDIATFSFYPTKNLGALGDGGMLVSHDGDRLKLARMLREYGWERRYVSERPGVNSRLDEIQAAVLRVRLRFLEEGNCRRRAIAAAYDRGFAGTGLALPLCQPRAQAVYHQYVVRWPERDRLQKDLRRRGIGTNIHYPVPIHLQPAYDGRCDRDPAGLKTTEAAAGEILSLPMYPELTAAQVSAVIDAVRDSL